MRGRLAATALATALVWTGAAEAKTFEVTRLGDPNPGKCKPRDCTLREAVLGANERPGKDVIVLPNRKKPYRLARAGAGEDAGLTGDLDINNDPLVIRHRGKGKATIKAGKIDRGLHIQAGAPTTLSKVVVTGGDAGLLDGGGIYTQASLKLLRSVVAGNMADDGGGVELDGVANLTMQRGAVRRNKADNKGGGLHTASDSQVEIVRSTIARNEAANDGGGLSTSGGETIRLIKSTSANNTSEGLGGGIAAVGSGILTIKSSTISGNRGQLAGGGLYLNQAQASAVNSTFAANRTAGHGGGIFNNGSMRLNAATVTHNVADTDQNATGNGGGAYNDGGNPFEVRNSLIALNRSATLRYDCGGVFESLGANMLTTDVGCAGFDEPTDRIRPSPKVAKLKRNGGPTKTVGLRKGSPAIGKAHRPSAPKRDQRGRKRDKKPDIGAFERRR